MRLWRLAISSLLTACLVLTATHGESQPLDPALSTATKRALDAYLHSGPKKNELSDGSSTAHWGILREIGIPELLAQKALDEGAWASIWAPVTAELDKRGFAELHALEALNWWEETRKDPDRFLRLLAARKLLDVRIPKDRKRGEDLREALGGLAGKLDEVRANVRYERAGWSFTGTASLVPGQRVVRVALSGSKPCAGTGRARSANLALKGRVFLDKSAPEGIKVQILEDAFTSAGCEETIKGRISEMVQLTLGGEARLSGIVIVEVKDDVLTGRVQLDLAYRPAGDALRTGHGVYSLRGTLKSDGTAHATLTPVSTSGHRDLREALAKAGSLEGLIQQGQGAGTLHLPLFRRPSSWRAAR